MTWGRSPRVSGFSVGIGAARGAVAAGRAWLLPVVFLGGLGFAGAAAAAPPSSERFYPGNGRPEDQPSSPFAQPARAAASRFRSETAGTDAAGGVEFALYLFAKTGTGSDRERAVRAARAAAGRDEPGSLRGLYRAAEAGAPTLTEAEGLFALRRLGEAGTRGSTADYAARVLELFARAAARRDRSLVEEASLAAATFLERRTVGDGDTLTVLDGSGEPTASLADLAGLLRVALEEASWSGEAEAKAVVRGAGRALASRLERSANGAAAGADSNALSEIAGGALSLWEAGWATGVKPFGETAESALLTILPAVTPAPGKGGSEPPEFGLAASRFSEHPVQMAMVGDPADSTVRALREAAWFTFEPRKVLLSLDPDADAAYLADLGYPVEVAPALFVCVGTLCSPPLQSADGLGKKVHDILALAAGARN